jgi:hypothetical protein
MKLIKHAVLWVTVILFSISGCARGLDITWKNDQVKTAIVETAISSIVETLAAAGIAPSPTPNESPTSTQMVPLPIATITLETTSVLIPTWELTPTPTLTSAPEIPNTPTPTVEAGTVESSARDLIRNRMISYGKVNEAQLSDAYWERLTRRIALYGSARNILTLEYHGDNYTMYNGQYSMSPVSFRDQVAYLMMQDYHFVTMHEAEGFVYGCLELPARSVILTTDISDLHVASMLSITDTFADLADTYGYDPHMLAFIWTGAMTKGACADNTCWQMLNQANETGYFTFGSHSTSHRDFGQITNEEGIADLQLSAKVMLDAMGIRAYSLAWPFETCSAYPVSIANLGMTLAWGGTTKPMSRNYTAWLDGKPFCLPRMLPPNIEGISMRPPGMNFQDMLSSALNAP